jgi:uncharacterized membrane protein
VPRAWRLPGAFAVIASCAGAGFVVTTPPLQAPDENRHLIRAYAIAGGELVATPYPGTPQHGVAAVEVPVSIIRMPERLGADIAFQPEVRQDLARVAAEWRRPLAPEHREWHALPSTYSPLVYAPQAAAVALARRLDPPPVAYVYLGRVANLAVYVALVAAALRLAPVHRWTLFLVALAPMAIFQAASLSPDAATNAIAWLFVAAVLGAACRSAPITRWELGGLIGLAASLGLLKPLAAVLAPLVLLVPAHRFGRGPWLAAGAGAVAAAVATGGLWYGTLTQLPLPVVVEGADEGAQLRGMLGDPVGYAGLLARSVVASAGLYARTTVGVLGWLDTELPSWVYPAWWAALAGVAVFDADAASPVRGLARAGCLALAIAGMLAAISLIYLINPIGHDPIGGVQGRYFLPFLPLGAIALQRGAGRGLPETARLAIPVFCAAILVVALGTTAVRYYGAP